jgi:hypothetical protein
MRHLWTVPAILLCASAAFASGDARTHDGFFLRLQGGPGWMRASNGDDDVALKGGGGAFNFEIGGALTRNFILYGKLFGAGVAEPDLELGDITIEDPGEDVTLGLGAVGAGVTYYFMPVNLYVSGAISAAQLTLDLDGERGETDVGPGLHLGVGAELALARAKDPDTDSSFNVASGFVFFSATYN